MALGKPRRIFVRAPRRRWRRFGIVTLACAGLLVIGARGGVLPAAGSIVHVAATQPPDAVTGENVAVVDGETLRLDGRVIRLDGVAAPLRGYGCAVAGDCAGRAALQLASLVRNQTVACTMAQADESGRATASCRAGSTDISQAVVASGWAHAARADLKPAEDRARAAHLGLWAIR